jgi:hypothetical protein
MTLANEIERVARDPALLASVGERNRRVAESQHSLSAYVGAIDAVIAAALGGVELSGQGTDPRPRRVNRNRRSIKC